jgi:hypothetical protein
VQIFSSLINIIVTTHQLAGKNRRKKEMAIINLAAKVMDFFHDGIANAAMRFSLGLNDKALHFIVIGAIGVVIYACIYGLLKFLAKRNINIIASICAFVIVVVLASAIEILQGVTGSGWVYFSYAAYGVFGFVFAMAFGFLIKKTFVIAKEILSDLRINGIQFGTRTS